MLKICFISVNSYHLFKSPSKARFTGADLDVYITSTSLAGGDDISVSCIVGDFGQKNNEIIQKVNLIKSISPRENGIFGGLISLYKYLLAFLKADSDVYIVIAAGYELGYFVFLSKLFRKKIIFRTASLVDVNKDFVLNNSWQGKIYDYGLKNADIITVCIKEHIDILNTHYRNTNQKIVYIPTTYRPFKNKIKISKFDILWVSTCYPLKQPQILSDLADYLPDNKITVIMPKSKHFIEYYLKMVKLLKQKSNIKLIEHVPVNKIDSYFKATKIFINTSEYEGYPLALLQAIAQNKPLVFLKVDPDNDITKYRLGYCSQNHKELFFNQIHRLISDKKKYKQVQQSCQNYYNKYHNPQLNNQQWFMLFNDLNLAKSSRNINLLK